MPANPFTARQPCDRLGYALHGLGAALHGRGSLAAGLRLLERKVDLFEALATARDRHGRCSTSGRVSWIVTPLPAS